MAEHSAVNRRVVGSSPTCGAKSNVRTGGGEEPLLSISGTEKCFGYMCWRIHEASFILGKLKRKANQISLRLVYYQLVPTTTSALLGDKNDYALYRVISDGVDTVGVWGSNPHAPTIQQTQ
jgi:hypothetical protein